MSNNHWTDTEKQLFKAFLTLKTEKEMADFCRDLMTIAEIKEFAKRLEMAKLLQEKSMSYEQIAEKLHTSTTTVTRVNQWLEYGNRGYQTALKRINNEKK